MDLPTPESQMIALLARMFAKSMRLVEQSHENSPDAVSLATEAFVYSRLLNEADRADMFMLWKATAYYISHMSTEDEINGVQGRFRSQVASLIPGATIVDVGSDANRKHIPDAWVEIAGERSPVEIKRRAFSQSAVSQLCRYMRAYKCRRGFAVAPKLTGTLAPGMTFVKLH